MIRIPQWKESHCRILASEEISKSKREPRFCEVMDSFVLLAYASLATSTTLLQRLLVCLDFTSDSEDLFRWYKKKVISMNYGSCTQPAENHEDE